MLRYKKNSPGRRKTGEIEVDGKLYKAKYIGRGQFSRVYRVGDRVIYYTRGDCTKEVLSMFRYERMMHLPEMIRHENITTVRGIWYVFSSPYYRNVTKKDGSAYELMMRVIKWHAAIYKKFNMYYTSPFGGVNLMQSVVNDLGIESDLPRSVIRALQEIVDVASNCGGKVGFDFAKRNFGVNEYGVLIFRDPIYVSN